MSLLATAQTHNIYGNKDANLGQLKDQRLKNSTYEDSLQQESLLALTQHGWFCDFLFTNCNNCMHLREVPAMLVIRPVGHVLTSCPFLLLCNMQTFVCRFCCPSTCQNSMDSTHQHNKKILIAKVMYIQSGLNVIEEKEQSDGVSFISNGRIRDSRFPGWNHKRHNKLLSFFWTDQCILSEEKSLCCQVPSKSKVSTGQQRLYFSATGVGCRGCEMVTLLESKGA